MDAEYELFVQQPNGVYLAPLPKINRCAYGRTENDAGEMTLIVPGDVYDLGVFAPFNRILVQRQLANQAPVIDLETPWFIVDGPYEILDQTGNLSWQIGCMDALGLILNSRNVAYNDNNSYTYKLDYADDMMREIMRENFGDLATDTTRNLAGSLSFAPENSAAPQIRMGSFARQQVLAVLQDIANASANNATTPTWLGFDVVLADPNAVELQFRTYISQRGVNHSWPNGTPPVVLDADLGTLANVQVGVSYKDVASYVYAGGPAIQDVRSVATDENDPVMALSPFARQEVYIDGTQLTDATALQQLATAEIRKRRPLRVFTAELVEKENVLRGVHWNYGDLLAAVWRSQYYTVRVNKIGITLEPGDGGGLAAKTLVSLRSEEATNG